MSVSTLEKVLAVLVVGVIIFACWRDYSYRVRIEGIRRRIAAVEDRRHREWDR